MSLFNIPARSRTVQFKLHTYPSNRVAAKLARLLKRDGVYKVRDEWANLSENRIYVIEIESDKPVNEVNNDLRNEIKSYLPDNFTKNYTFDFPDFVEDRPPFGFIFSFRIYGESGLIMEGYHRHKEIKKK